MLDWRGGEILERARRGAIAGLSEVGLRAEAGAKAELYPGHGKLTGVLQRAIQAEPARAVTPTRVRVTVAVKGVRYAARINRRYDYMREGYRKAVGSRAKGIVTDGIRREVEGQ